MKKKKNIGEAGVLGKDPSIYVWVDKGEWHSDLRKDGIVMPLTRKDVASLFLTTFQIMKDNEIFLSPVERQEIIDYWQS